MQPSLSYYAVYRNLHGIHHLGLRPEDKTEIRNFVSLPPWMVGFYHRVAERQMRTTGLFSCVLFSRCYVGCLFSRKSTIGIPIEFAILLQRARTELDWEFASLLYSGGFTVNTSGFFTSVVVVVNVHVSLYDWNQPWVHSSHSFCCSVRCDGWWAGVAKAGMLVNHTKHRHY